MRPITVAELTAEADAFDAGVAATEGIDRFCSSSAWILAADAALMPPRESWIHRGDSGWFAAMRGRHASGVQYLEPLELAWGLASPMIGTDPVGLAEEVSALLARRREYHVALIAGLAPDAPLLRALLRHLPPEWDCRFGQPTVRHVASLDGGLDGFLARRSRNFRKALRAAERAAADAGITFESVRASTPAEGRALYARVLAVEERSWKTTDGVGITTGPMRAFYDVMIQRLATRGQQRTLFARQGDQDLAYVLGAVFAGEYRGLQFSYDDAHARFSLGSLCQLHQIAELCGDGVERYDLGTDMDYKRRWAETPFETAMLVIVPR